MATTGMGSSEYWGKWDAQLDRIRIHGTKREGRERAVPLVERPASPRMHPCTFLDKLRERTRGEVTPYDFRRTFAHWMEEAGIPRARRRLYMGHGARDVTDLYEVHRVTSFLREDTARLADSWASPTESPTVSRCRKHDAHRPKPMRV